MPEVCSTCKAPIRWALTQEGKFMPFDIVPNPKGEWRLASARPGYPPRAIRVPQERRAELAAELMMVHWATCPDASRHRRRYAR